MASASGVSGACGERERVGRPGERGQYVLGAPRNARVHVITGDGVAATVNVPTTPCSPTAAAAAAGKRRLDRSRPKLVGPRDHARVTRSQIGPHFQPAVPNGKIRE